jgi:hypothetical protein
VEVCSNGRDDDCDGSSDEAGCAALCPDDDADGYAVCGEACSPAPGDVCGDCNDDMASVHPGASDDNCNGVDEDCSGTPDQGFIASATSCGAGPCARTGVTSCTGGVFSDSCVPGTAAPSDTSCNATDDDCDGSVDENYVQQPTLCGLGVCARTGSTSCVGGFVFDSCVAGNPAPELCDGLDNDCDGTVDDPCSQLITPADASSIDPLVLTQSFTWTAGSQIVYQVQISNVADFSVIKLKSAKGFKIGTAWTPSAKKWKKIKTFAPAGSPIYWRVVGKAAGSKVQVVSEVFGFTVGSSE